MTKVTKLQDYKQAQEQAIINASLKLGDNIAFDLMDIEPTGTDNTAMLYSAWFNLTICLMLRGWTGRELRKDVTFASKIAKDIE